MKLNKKTQYGILLVLYIHRAGRATLENTALSLNLSRGFLEQVARQLRLAGIIKSVRGRSGGYEAVGQPTIGDVVGALNTGTIAASYKARMAYSRGAFEHRALSRCMSTLNAVASPVFKSTVLSLGNDLVAQELGRLESAEGKGH